MNNLNWQSQDIEWVEQIRLFLLDLARACLGDIPKLPNNTNQKAMPLVQKTQSLLETAKQQGVSGSSDLDWLQQVNQLLLDLVRLSLSEQPKVPENLSKTALELAQQAQKIKETGGIAIASASEPPAAESSQSSTELFESLIQHLKSERSQSVNPDAAEWQQLMSLLEIAQGLYQRLTS